MVAKQAPIELIAARRAGIRDRFLLLDTESDRASMALGRWSQPTVIVPESWGASRVGPHWASGDRLRRMPGTFSHIGLSAERRSVNRSSSFADCSEMACTTVVRWWGSPRI